MPTITLLILELILCLTIQTILYKNYKTLGLYTYVIAASLISSLMSLKTINLFNYDINLGIIPFVTIITSSNILIQKKGPDSTKQLILTLSASFLVSYIILYIIHYMTPSNINLFTNASYDNIFVESPRIYFTSFVANLYSLLLNSKLYYYLKKMKNNILISNLFSSVIIQFIASILFGIIAFIFTKDIIDIIKIIMIRYLLSILISLIGTIPIYLTKNITE